MIDLKLGYHAASWGDEGLIDALKEISDSGYIGVEVLPSIVERFEDRHAVFQEIMSDLGLSLAAIQGAGHYLDPERAEEDIERNMTIARFLKTNGADRLVLLPPKKSPDNPPDALERVSAVFKNIAERCAEHGVRACVRPLPESIIFTTEEIDRMLQLVAPPKKDKTPCVLSLCLDTGDLHLSGADVKRAIKKYKDHLSLIHFRDIGPIKIPNPARKGRNLKVAGTVRVGKGEIDFAALVDVIHEIDYKGWIIVCGTVGGEVRPSVMAAESRVALRKLGFI
jgi:inosose dehydratase